MVHRKPCFDLSKFTHTELNHKFNPKPCFDLVLVRKNHLLIDPKNYTHSIKAHVPPYSLVLFLSQTTQTEFNNMLNCQNLLTNGI